jgi:hypothetical protein
MMWRVWLKSLPRPWDTELLPRSPQRLRRVGAVPKQAHVLRVGLRMIALDQVQQRGFSRPIGSQHQPALFLTHCPCDLAEDWPPASRDGDAAT